MEKLTQNLVMFTQRGGEITLLVNVGKNQNGELEGFVHGPIRGSEEAIIENRYKGMTITLNMMAQNGMLELRLNGQTFLGKK